MGNAMHKDGTAQGIAKVRHHESLFPPERRLYHDPFAYAMFPGSTVQRWMGPNLLDGLYRCLGMTGFVEMISIRTRWLDDRIMDAVAPPTETVEPAGQLIILGAGYDTRGFRLDLWKDGTDAFAVVEVDQPEVQEKKRANLQWLAGNDETGGQVVADRIATKRVQFLPVNFTTDDLREKLQSTEGFRSDQCSVVTMEGVTQYIPKESTSDTLTKLKNLLGKGSTVLITYVDQKCFYEPDQLPRAFRMVRGMAAKVGEPWVSGWTKEEFTRFLKDLGYEVVSDTAPEDYNGTYLKSVGRELDEGDLLSMERFVVAKVM